MLFKDKIRESFVLAHIKSNELDTAEEVTFTALKIKNEFSI